MRPGSLACELKCASDRHIQRRMRLGRISENVSMKIRPSHNEGNGSQGGLHIHDATEEKTLGRALAMNQLPKRLPATGGTSRISKRVPVCPHCGSGPLHWSRTKWWELLMRMVFIRAYRCRPCRYRGYLW